LDVGALSHYIHDSNFQFVSYFLETEKLAQDLLEGKIVGVARGRAEHGARALGNRSILCNPSIPDMKDTLNEKVKHREWYRPFAPVVRLEDVSKYFEWEGESRWMSFCPKVKEEWREKLAAITHIDGTARVQTVTREQNEWLYDLLTEFDRINGVGVLLNTSFNVDGKPILSSIKDAFKILESTQMDGLVIENYYFKKI
jgi:carbamoyltransferase